MCLCKTTSQGDRIPLGMHLPAEKGSTPWSAQTWQKKLIVKYQRRLQNSQTSLRHNFTLFDPASQDSTIDSREQQSSIFGRTGKIGSGFFGAKNAIFSFLRFPVSLASQKFTQISSCQTRQNLLCSSLDHRFFLGICVRIRCFRAR